MSAPSVATYRTLVAARRTELTALARRTWEVVLLAAIVGALTGVAVSLLDTIILGIEERAAEWPLWAVALAPAAGLAIAALLLRWVGQKCSPSTADEYLKAFHDVSHPFPGRPFVARLLGSIATLGLGGPMGLEGISIYTGTGIGSWIRNLTGRLPSARDRRVLLVAGAAAGVAAIFKAPATGAVFALEVPYQDDLARNMLLPSLVGAASGYLTFAAFHGTDSLFQATEGIPFNYRDLVAAIGLGILAAIGARLFARGLKWAKGRSTTTSAWLRVVVAGGLLALFVLVSNWACGAPLSFGPGYSAITWALDPNRALWAVAVLLVVRCLATITVIGGGGVGGLFVPLVVGGALTGRLVGGAMHSVDESLFTVIGVAAFLGAGYRVPLAAVMFVAETTGQPGFIVPGLLAAVAAELVMGSSSVTSYQKVPHRKVTPEDAPPTGKGGRARAGAAAEGAAATVEVAAGTPTGSAMAVDAVDADAPDAVRSPAPVGPAGGSGGTGRSVDASSGAPVSASGRRERPVDARAPNRPDPSGADAVPGEREAAEAARRSVNRLAGRPATGLTAERAPAPTPAPAPEPATGPPDAGSEPPEGDGPGPDG